MSHVLASVRYAANPNDPAACMSLLDTLVEKGYGVRIFYDDITLGIENRWVVEVLSDKSYWGAHKLFNEAIVAACLEVARKEQEMSDYTQYSHEALCLLLESNACQIDRLKRELEEARKIAEKGQYQADYFAIRDALDISRIRNSNLEAELARYRNGVEVEGYANTITIELHEHLPNDFIFQRVKVLVMKG